MRFLHIQYVYTLFLLLYVMLAKSCQLAKRIVRPRWHPTTLCPLGHWHSLHANTLDGCCEGDWFTFIMCQCKADTCHCHASDHHHCFWLLRTTYLMICCQMCRVSCVFVTSRNRIREPKCCCFKGFFDVKTQVLVTLWDFVLDMLHVHWIGRWLMDWFKALVVSATFCHLPCSNQGGCCFATESDLRCDEEFEEYRNFILESYEYHGFLQGIWGISGNIKLNHCLLLFVVCAFGLAAVNSSVAEV